MSQGVGGRKERSENSGELEVGAVDIHDGHRFYVLTHLDEYFEPSCGGKS
jgi:hypothetical protein